MLIVHALVKQLNMSLTVQEAKAGSHSAKGWHEFTSKVIEIINAKKEGVVFLLWGLHAQKAAKEVDGKRHKILKAGHPSPLSATQGFFGSKPFSKTNEYLTSRKQKPIDWKID